MSQVTTETQTKAGFDWRVGAAIATSVLAWASAFISIRSAGHHFSAGALALGRMAVATVAVMAVLIVRREGLPKRGAWPGIVFGGIFWYGLYMVSLNWAEQRVDAGTAAMVVNTGPILIALLSALFLRESLPKALIAGMGVSFVGALVVGYSQSKGGSAPVLGVLACVVAAITYATGVVAQKPALKHGSALQVTAFSCLIATIACLPFAGQLLDGLREAPADATANMVYLGLVPTALAFTTWGYALARTTASKMGATTYVVPAIVVLMSWLLLGEVPAWLTVAGGALCLVGVAITRKRR